MEREKFVDESWKESAAQEKEKLEGLANAEAPGPGSKKAGANEEHSAREAPSSGAAAPGDNAPEDSGSRGGAPEVSFLNYVTSLAYQAMIFLGEIPNPHTEETDKNLQQAKFIIDTLIMMQEKTKGNLTKQEENMINATAYELQMKYVDLARKEEAQAG